MFYAHINIFSYLFFSHRGLMAFQFFFLLPLSFIYIYIYTFSMAFVRLPCSLRGLGMFRGSRGFLDPWLRFTKLKLNSLEEDEIRNLWSYMEWAESIDREEFASQIRNLKGLGADV